MDKYLREETNIERDDESKQMILQASISSIKRNTLIEKMWSVHHISSLDVFKEYREEDLNEAWANTVLQPS
uniref:Uncharacterized protein n=1 Tax=Solanum lycopersicum TaxID=4081 RepID=A0A3Q7IIP5_SOLLC